MPPFSRTDLTGRTFHRWTVLGYDEPSTQQAQQDYYQRHSRSVSPAMWRCRCQCGTIKSIRSHSLLQDKSRSCGCLRAEERTRAARARRENKQEDFC